MGEIMKEAFIIAREEPITLNDINNRYTHNERKCSSYINKNIDLTKSKDNYHLYVNEDLISNTPCSVRGVFFYFPSTVPIIAHLFYFVNPKKIINFI